MRKPGNTTNQINDCFLYEMQHPAKMGLVLTCISWVAEAYNYNFLAII